MHELHFNMIEPLLQFTLRACEYIIYYRIEVWELNSPMAKGKLNY